MKLDTKFNDESNAKNNHANTESSQFRQLSLAAPLAIAVATTACAKQSEHKVEAARSGQAAVKQVSVQSVTPAVQPSEVKIKTVAKTTQPATKTLRYKSRDYGVSFEYPWQYEFVNAKTVSSSEK